MKLLPTLKFVGQMLSGAGIRECEHLDSIVAPEPSTHDCEGCVAEGTRWMHLRMCMTCGYVGCCDTSARTHMRGHAEGTGHPLARSIEDRESWVWCYPHNRLVRRKL
jgi:uncharacterized UBP type Zn finger protein